jgi:uncharacterized protein YbjT (DUF2867 family)
MHLVVSGSGQLGTVLVRQLVAAGTPVRAFVRPMSQYRHLVGSGAELAFGDLRDAGSVRAAVAGADIVLATANVAAPKPGDSHDSVEAGYQALISEAADQGVKRFVFSSVPVNSVDDQVPTFRAKRQTEKALMASGLPYTILRCAPFMEVWLAFPGSSIPSRGEENPTVDRPYPFMRRFRGLTGKAIEDKGRMTVNGRASLRNAFVSLHDVARLMIAAAEHPQTRNQVFDEVLGRPVKVSTLPPGLFRGMQQVLRPFAPAASNAMGMNYLIGISETPWDSNELARLVGVGKLRTVRDFLTDKAALPEQT